jgi:DNA-binding transcriptional MerR regulator
MAPNPKVRPSARKVAKPAERSHEPPSAERPLKIGEAARTIGVEPYVLRFWETQFPFLRPHHSPSRHRSYEPRDIETLKLIKRLLHSEGFTIAGAKKHIREHGLERLRGQSAVKSATAEAMPATPAVNGSASPSASRHLRKALAEIRRDLESLHRLLQD